MRFFSLIVLLLAIVQAFESFSQDTIPRNNKLQRNFLNNNGKWTVEIPVWIPGFRGQYTYGDVSLEGEDGVPPEIEQPIEKPGLGDIFKRLFKTEGSLNFVFMSRISYTSDKIYAQLDGFSGAVGSNTTFRYNNAELIKAKFSTNLYRLFAGYEIVETWSESQKSNYHLYAYGGIRLQDINIQTELDRRDFQKEISPIWIEPIVGLRNELALERWKFILNGDLGFLGDTERISYMISFNASFRISNLISVKAGWTDWDTNYKGDVKGEDLTLYLHLSGPSTALTFHF